VQVRVTLDESQLERLELIVAYRRGKRTRSAVVREAIEWQLAKEAAWLLRAQAASAERDRRAQLAKQANEPPIERRAIADREAIEAALRVIESAD
jgi:Ribbon-helix-helix protein, copG family